MRRNVMALAIACVFCGTALGQAYTIPGRFPSIQAAIDGAPHGSLIRVSAGTYGFSQALNVNKRLYFLAVDGPDHTIDYLRRRHTAAPAHRQRGDGPGANPDFRRLHVP